MVNVTGISDGGAEPGVHFLGGVIQRPDEAAICPIEDVNEANGGAFFVRYVLTRNSNRYVLNPIAVHVSQTSDCIAEQPPLPLLTVVKRSEEHTSELQSPC